MISIIIKSAVSAAVTYFLTPLLLGITNHSDMAGIYLIICYVLPFLWSYLVLSGFGFGLERGGIGVIGFPILFFVVGGAFALVTFAFVIGVSMGETLGNGLPWDSLIGVPLTAVLLLWHPIRDIKRVFIDRE